MPAYISHTIMARDVYDKINNKNVNLDYMITFSLGGDLSKHAKCRKDTHRVKKDEFIYDMCDYMIKNKLTNDSECLGVLYGHICHMVMDDVMHPLVRSIDRACIKDKNNHTFIEKYIDGYLVKYKYMKRMDKHKIVFKGKLNKKVSKMLDYVYYLVYNTKHISRYYRYNISLYKKIKYLYKILGINFIKKITGYNKFIERNKNINIMNTDRKIFYKNYLGYKENESVINLYNESVLLATLYIENINRYLGIE